MLGPVISGKDVLYNQEATMTPLQLFIRILLVTILCTNQISLAIAAEAITDDTSDAALWRSLTMDGRKGIILGYKLGTLKTYRKTTEYWLATGYFRKKPSANDLARIKAKVYTAADTLTVVGGTSKLYEDPANAYVILQDAIYMAIDRLKGNDIEQQLREARQSGYEIHVEDAAQK